MKKILFTSLIICNLQVPALSQESFKEFIYKVTFSYDSTNISEKKTEVMTLQVSNKMSYFTSVNQLKSDSVLEKLKSSYVPGDPVNFSGRSIPRPIFNYRIIKKNDRIEYYGIVAGEKYWYEEKRNNIKWTIRADERIINNIACQKAVGSFGGRNYTAWFSTSIPLNDGPYKFDGLPGLIVKISDKKNHYVFELIDIKDFPKIKNKA